MTQPITWTTERWAVSKLKEHPSNPRRFTKKGMEDLKASITALGYIDPIAINTDGTILSGHARKKTLQEMKIKQVDVRVPSRTLTEQEMKQALVRMNRNQAGEWNFDTLANEFEIEDLVDWGFDPEEFGIDSEEGTEADSTGDSEDEAGGIQCFTCPACKHEFTVVREGKRP